MGARFLPVTHENIDAWSMNFLFCNMFWLAEVALDTVWPTWPPYWIEAPLFAGRVLRMAKKLASVVPGSAPFPQYLRHVALCSSSVDVAVSSDAQPPEYLPSQTFICL